MDDVITTDRFLSAFPQWYHKTDVFYTPRAWARGQIVQAPSGPQQCILAGHSDYPITDEIVQRHPASVWWAVNSQSLKVNGLPLGITNDCDDSPIHRIYGNTQIMKEVVEEPRMIKNRVYLNFSMHTHPSRQHVYNLFCTKPWVTVGTPVNTMDGRKEFLREVRNHEFVLCPRGNGVDTHRLWETLYMGSIPIVQRDIAHRGWEDLPIAWVDSWEEVTPEWLDAQLERIRSGTWAMEKLKASYWIDQIRRSLQL